ncbi:SCO7613 C-terminal domain-containing membrane protein [Aeromicrobium sp.]|uniref:SCO7613 C-terminal domain-containing membrane protein n=1 Tax=Aeromicrobium sp. TaxID=1871063 RepID=UPI0035193868
MAYADPTVCPDCRARLDGARVCARCGLDLRTAEAGRLWNQLLRVDRDLERARHASRPATVTAPVPTAAVSVPTVPPPPVAPVQAPATAPAAAPAPAAAGVTPSGPAPSRPTVESVPTVDSVAATTPRAPVSVGTVLLALGALALLVAGAIFITVYWGPMGILGRALVLLAATLVAGGVATVVTRRRLRASAEALWTVFLGLFTLDWFAARDQGLLGLDTLPSAPWDLLWCALVVLATAGIVRFGRRTLDDARELVVVSVLGGLAGAVAGVRVAVLLDDGGARPFWSATAALGVAVLVGAALHRATARGGAWFALAAGGVAALVAIVLALADAVAHPALRDLLGGAHGVPLTIVAGVAAGAASLGRLPATARTISAGAALSTLTLLAALPAWSAAPQYGALLVLAAVAVPAVWVPGRGPWARGARAAGIAPSLLVALALFPWGAQLLAVVGEALSTTGGQRIDHPLTTFDVPGTDRPWLAWTLGAAATLVVLGAARWRVLRHLRPWSLGGAASVAVVTAWSVLADAGPSAVLLAGSVVAGALVLWAVTTFGTPAGEPAPWAWVSVATLGVAPALALDAPWACVVVWAASTLGLVVVALVRAPRLRSAVALGLAAAWGPGTAGALVVALDGDAQVRLAALVAAVVLTFVVGVLLVDDDARRTGVETGVAAALLVTVATSAAEVTPGAGAIAALSVGATLALVAAAPHGRRVVHPALAATAVVVADLLVAGDWSTAWWVWGAAALVAVVAARAARPAPAQEVPAAVGTVLVGLALVPPLLLADLATGAAGVVLSGAAALALLVSGTGLRDRSGRVGVEVGSGLLAVGGVLVAAAVVDLDVVWLAATLLLPAAAAVLVSLLVADRAVLRAVGGVLAAAAVVVCIGDWGTAVVAWPLAAVLLGVCALPDDGQPWRDVATSAAAGTTIVSTVPVLALVDAPATVASLVVLLTALVVGAGASALLDDRRGRRGVELAAATVLIVTVLWAAGTTSLGWLALLLTLLGATLVLVSLLVPDRAALRWVAPVPLGIAYVLRLVASDVGVVEAYTVPFALVLLAAGAWVLLRTEPPRSTVVALGPGLVLGLLPSLPQALLAPTSPRGLALGLVSLAVLALGVRLRWLAPFAAGAVLVGLLLLVQLGPVAVALPRWILIAVAGVSMLAVGMTWESRVRDGRAAARWIGAMR